MLTKDRKLFNVHLYRSSCHDDGTLRASVDSRLADSRRSTVVRLWLKVADLVERLGVACSKATIASGRFGSCKRQLCSVGCLIRRHLRVKPILFYPDLTSNDDESSYFHLCLLLSPVKVVPRIFSASGSCNSQCFLLPEEHLA